MPITNAICQNIAMATMVIVLRMSIKRTALPADTRNLAFLVTKLCHCSAFQLLSIFLLNFLPGYCFQGDCPTLNLQCEAIWGYGGAAADRQCFEQFNSKGSINGHCGRDPNEHYIKCEPEWVLLFTLNSKFYHLLQQIISYLLFACCSRNVQCGTLQCKEGERQPVTEGVDQLYSRTIISIKGLEYECK